MLDNVRVVSGDAVAAAVTRERRGTLNSPPGTHRCDPSEFNDSSILHLILKNLKQKEDFINALLTPKPPEECGLD